MAEGNVLLLAGFMWTFIVIAMTLLLRRTIRKYWLDVNKIWTVSLNGNTGLGVVKLVKPSQEGIKDPFDGKDVKTELNFLFKNKADGNGIAVLDSDTKLLMRPYSGEVEMLDPAAGHSSDMTTHIETIKTAVAGFPFLPLILAASVISVLLIIGMFVYLGQSA